MSDDECAVQAEAAGVKKAIFRSTTTSLAGFRGTLTEVPHTSAAWFRNLNIITRLFDHAKDLAHALGSCITSLVGAKVQVSSRLVSISIHTAPCVELSIIILSDVI